MRQVAKLCSDIFQEGLLACLKELSIPTDHPAWATAAPELALSDFLKDYLPIILLGFNEEEYMNQPVEKGNQSVYEVGNTNAEDELGAREGE